MRVLAVTPYYAPDGGGLERYAHELLRRLARDHEVVAIAAGTGACVERRDGVRVERHPPRVRLANSPIDPGLRARIARRLDAERFDVVWAHSPVPFPAEMAWLASRGRAPFALTYHSGRLQASTRLLAPAAALHRATLQRRMLAGSAALVAVGRYVRDHALARHRERVRIVPPGVDAAHFAPADEPPPSQDILFVGPLARSYRWKGVDVLLRAFAKVRAQAPGARLVLVGDGDRLAALRARNLPGVALPGRLGDAALAQAYRSCAALCLPSTTDAESFGMVLAEANACGRPVVGSRVGGIPDFVRPGDNGLLAEPGDAGDLAEKLLFLLREPERAATMGRRGRERVLREHDWDRLAAATERVLADAAALGPRA